MSATLVPKLTPSPLMAYVALAWSFDDGTCSQQARIERSDFGRHTFARIFAVAICRLALPNRARKAASFNSVSIAPASASASSSRNEQRIHAIAGNFPAPGNVGRDQGPAARGRFQQAFWQTFPPRRKNGHVRLRPRRCVCRRRGREAEGSRRAASRRARASGIEAGLKGSGSPAKQGANRKTALREQLMRAHERPHAFVVEQASDKGNRERSGWLRQRRQAHRYRRRSPE